MLIIPEKKRDSLASQPNAVLSQTSSTNQKATKKVAKILGDPNTTPKSSTAAYTFSKISAGLCAGAFIACFVVCAHSGALLPMILAGSAFGLGISTAAFHKLGNTLEDQYLQQVRLRLLAQQDGLLSEEG